MKKFLIAAATASIFAAAVPAAAQYYPAPPPPGYGYGYGNQYAQHQGLVRSYMIRADRLRSQIERLDARDRISEREARRLREDARELRARILQSSRNGLNWEERRRIEQRLARLEQRIFRDVRDGRNGYNGYGNRQPWSDRDRDGRNDYHEDDRGRYPG